MAEDEQQQQLILPIIDCHIHLYHGRDVEDFNWWKPDHPLAGDHTLKEYKEAAASAPSLLGYIFVETDCKHDLETGAADGSGWELPLKEFAYMRRVALGQPDDGDVDSAGSAEEAAKCLALVPWAPLPSGAEVMERYIARLREEAGEAWPKVKGFRLLVQDLPAGTMTDDKFISSLKLLGKLGLIFEVGVDHHRRGKKQLDEMTAMIEKAHDGVPEEEKVTLIVNHLCKPDLTIYNLVADPSFHAWRTAIFTLGKCSNTYMKLSGAFSELPDGIKNDSPSRIFEATFGWLGVLLATFGPSRIMFGSDWPVCTPGVDDAWARWRDVVEKMCWMATLSDEERAMIFGGTAKKAYSL